MRFLIRKRFFLQPGYDVFLNPYSNKALLYAEQYCLVVIFSLVLNFGISILLRLMVFYENIFSIPTIIDADG